MGAEADAEEAFGPYLVYERLGIGGMATVHRARERGIEGFERIVALKRLLPHLAEDASFIKAFVREAKLASALNHVNIVQIYELGRVGTEYFISMEHIDGRDIRRVLRHARKVTGPPPPNVTVGLLLQLCDALDYAHTKIDEHGVPMQLVHRDVSPSNVLITSGGNVKVIDFGIAKAQSSQLRTQTGRVKGKLAYMAPEAISGGKDLDARSDLFAVGVIAHELLTARPLFASKNEYQTLLKVQRGDIMPPSTFNQNVPAELDAIVLRALARDPDDRFSSAAELRDELLALRHKYRLQTGVRDVSMWLDWAFSLDDAMPSGAVSSDAPIADLAWGGGEGSGSPIVLDDVPDVSQRVVAPSAQLLRESQPRLFDEDPSIDVSEDDDDDDDDDDDTPTPVPALPRRPSTPNITAPRTTTASRAASPSSPPSERRSSELLDALHAANDAAATLQNMPPAHAFGVDTQPTGRALTKPADRPVDTGTNDIPGEDTDDSTGETELASTDERRRSMEMERISTGQIARPSQPEMDDETSVVTSRAPDAPTFDPSIEVDDIDPTTGKSKRRAPQTTEDPADAVIDPPRPGTKLGVGRDTPMPSRATPVPSRTAVGVARNTPNPAKTAPMIQSERTRTKAGVSDHSRSTGPEEPIDDSAPMVRVAQTKPMGMRRAAHTPSPSTPIAEASPATSPAVTSQAPTASQPSLPPAGISIEFKTSHVESDAAIISEPKPVDPSELKAPEKKPRTKLGHKPARASTTTPTDDDDAAATMISSERRAARQPNPASSIGMSIIEREAKPNRTWLVLALIALVGGGAAATLYLTRAPSVPAKPIEDKTPVTTGSLALELDPTDAEISIDGTQVHVGSPWTTELSAGTHSIEIHKEGFKAWLTTLTVRAGEPQMLRVALAPLGGVSAGSGSVSKPAKAPAPVTAPAGGTPPARTAPPNESRGEVIAVKPDVVAQVEAPTAAPVVPPTAAPTASTAIPMATTLYAGTTPPPAAPATTASLSPESKPVETAKIATNTATNTASATTAAPPAPAIAKPVAPTTPMVVTTGAPATVPPSAVKKLSGELPELVSKNDVATVVAAKLCIDWQGNVTSVQLITKLEPRMELEMKKTLALWKYSPYQAPSARVPSAACFAVSFRTK